MSRPGLALYAALMALGIGWGVTIPLAKIAVSTGHQPLGLIFWQLFVVVVFLGVLIVARGRWPRFGRRYMRLFVMVALCGAVLPDMFYYLSAIYLPGGVMAIIAATTTMFSLPIALALGNESFQPARLLGVVVGFVGIVLLIAPKASLPDTVPVGFVLVALLAPMLYATEGNLVMKWGTQDLDPLEVVFGASLVGMVLSAPLAWGSGQWISPWASFGAPEIAMAVGAALHALVYAGYVWLVGQAGPVFAAQSSYIVTAFGVMSSMVMLNERYSIWVWLALGVMMLGMFLVQPRQSRNPVPARAIKDATNQEGAYPR